MAYNTELFHEWRAADRAACAAERAVTEASMRYLHDRGAPAADDKLVQAARLRELANDLLDAALSQIDGHLHSAGVRLGADCHS